MPLPRSFSRICSFIAALLLLAFAGGWYLNIRSHSGIWYHIPDILEATGFSGKLKAGIDRLSTGDTLWMQALIQALVLAGIQRTMPFRRWNLLRTVVAADLIAATLLNVPFTGAGQLPVAAIQQFIDQSPAGIPLPSLQPMAQQIAQYPQTASVIGDWSLYSKKPGTDKQVAYPIVLKKMQQFFDSDSAHRQTYLQRPFLFCTDSASRIELLEYNPQYLKVKINAEHAGSLVMQQITYPHWQYTLNGKPETVQTYDGSFMQGPVITGVQKVVWEFNPAGVKRMMMLSLICWTVSLLLLAAFSIHRFRNK